MPGISSALSAPLFAGVPLTDKALSRHFVVMSCHDPGILDWAAFKGIDTLVRGAPPPLSRSSSRGEVLSECGRRLTDTRQGNHKGAASTLGCTRMTEGHRVGQRRQAEHWRTAGGRTDLYAWPFPCEGNMGWLGVSTRRVSHPRGATRVATRQLDSLHGCGPPTQVLLMAARQLPEVVRRLQTESSRAESTAVLIVRSAGTPEETVWEGTLGTILHVTAGETLSPCVVVVGAVADRSAWLGAELFV